MTKYDILIIGGGPAGLTASVYAMRAGKKTALIEKGVLGGQLAYTYEVKNYLGFDKITGFDLADKMSNQAKSYGLPVLVGEVISISPQDTGFVVKYTNGEAYAERLILSMGATAKHLQVEGEQEFTGRGVSYCATCDGNLFKNLEVAVVGGGDTAFGDAIYLSALAQKVYLIHRSDSFKANQENQAQVAQLVAEGKVEMLTNTVVKSISGDKFVTSIDIHNTKTGKAQTLSVRGVFVAIGSHPNTDIVSSLVELDEHGYIKVDDQQHTSRVGIFAAGDITTTPLRQIMTACADGAIAGTEAVMSLKK